MVFPLLLHVFLQKILFFTAILDKNWGNWKIMKEKIVRKMEKVRIFVWRIIFTHAADCRRDNTTDCAAAPIVSHCINTPRLLLSNLIQSYQIPINYNQVPSKAALLAGPAPGPGSHFYGAVIHNYLPWDENDPPIKRQATEAQFLSAAVSVCHK